MVREEEATRKPQKKGTQAHEAQDPQDREPDAGPAETEASSAMVRSRVVTGLPTNFMT